MIAYNYCPQCGGGLTLVDSLPHCATCRETFYRNAKPCASILLVDDGKVLLAKRGREPFLGAYDIVGGFMEPDELPEAAAIREAKEETGLDVRVTKLLGMYIDRYGEDGDYTLNIHYVGEVTGGEMRAMDDVAALEWVPIMDAPLDSGFQNTRDGLRDLKALFETSQG